MYNIFAVTNRKLVKNDFKEQIEKICSLNRLIKNSSSNNLPDFLKNAEEIKIVLREKDLPEKIYRQLAEEVSEICRKYDTEFIIHYFPETAAALKSDKIYLPLWKLKENPDIAKKFKYVQVSVHSEEEAKEAEKIGASALTAGHIFNTDCKKGLPGRGTEFLKNIVSSVNIPVFAIGGINKNNIQSVLEAGASGVCIMSAFMKL